MQSDQIWNKKKYVFRIKKMVLQEQTANMQNYDVLSGEILWCYTHLLKLNWIDSNNRIGHLDAIEWKWLLWALVF